MTLSLSGLSLLAVDLPLTPFDETRVTLTYRARLADARAARRAGDRNTAGFTGVSAPDRHAGGAALHRQRRRDLVTVVMPVTLDKSIIATSLPETGTPGARPCRPRVGETITYRLAATLSEGTQTLVIRDSLPAGLEVLSASLVTRRRAASRRARPTITIAGQDVTFDFGTVVNTGNNIPGDGIVTVEIVRRACATCRAMSPARR